MLLAPLKVLLGDGERRSARQEERKEPRRSWKRTRSILISAMAESFVSVEALSGRFGTVVEALVSLVAKRDNCCAIIAESTKIQIKCLHHRLLS